MYLSTHELASSARRASDPNAARGLLPFDHCALSLTPYESPCMGPEGVIFDLTNLVPYLQKHKKNPISGGSMTTRDIIRLNIAKNAAGEWQCPVTFKVFNDSSHVVAVRTTGNVYSYDAVLELNIKAKNFEDLMTGEAFEKKDIVTLFNGQDVEHSRSRDISTFAHLKEVREDTQAAQAGDSRVRHNPISEKVLVELSRLRDEEEQSGVKKRALEEIFGGTVGGTAGFSAVEDSGEDVAELLALQPTTEQINPGSKLTSAAKSGGLTSTSFGSIETSSSTRLARPSEIREARFRKMKELGSKAFVQLQTNFGQINLELYCNIAPATCWNFLALCARGYYDGKHFHRLVPGFTLQGGAETAGKGGSSAFPRGRAFADEFDPRLKHESRGMVSMANSGPDCNKSQFFITLGECTYLDGKHSVFGRVVGGAATLDRIEATGADAKERPLTEVIIVRATMFGSSPVEESDAALRADILAKKSSYGPESGAAASAASATQLQIFSAVMTQPVVGKYMQQQPAANSDGQNDEDDNELKVRVVKRLKAAQGGGGEGFGDFSSW